MGLQREGSLRKKGEGMIPGGSHVDGKGLCIFRLWLVFPAWLG